METGNIRAQSRRRIKRVTFLSVLCALCVFAVSFYFLRTPTTPPIKPSPTATPAPLASNKIGLHTRLTDEPTPESIKREFAMLRDMGGSWATEFFPWIYIQKDNKLFYDWDHADKVADAANTAGITLIARLDGVPQWARPEDSTWRYLDSDHYSDYGDFVYAFVSHFKGRIKYYVIWNEPNTAAEWGQRPPDPAAYADLLKVAYRRAKEADPTCIVLMAGLAPNLEREGSTVAMNDLTYLERLYEAGAAPYFDAVAVHAYGLTSPPDDPAGPNKLNFARAEEIRNVMLQHGDGAKFVYITEGGWNDSPRWSYAVKPYQRIQYTVDAYKKAEHDWPWVKAVTLWASRYPKPAYTYFDSYTFLTPDFIPKAVYLEVQKYARNQESGIGSQESASPLTPDSRFLIPIP